MNIFLVLTFLFFTGSLLGWILEVFWRKFFSRNNPDHRWINPGFLHGCYLPLYGLSLCLLFTLSFIPVNIVSQPVFQKIILFAIMALSITVMEYIGGLIFIKGMNIKLWDYSSNWGNIKGIICPQYTFYWWILSGLYYFLIHPKILSWLYWFTNHLTFCLVIGFFYGVFTVDIFYTMNIAAKIRKIGNEEKIKIRYESLKASIQKINEEIHCKKSFLMPFHSRGRNLSDNLKELFSSKKDDEIS